jgi:hypothetical protein
MSIYEPEHKSKAYLVFVAAVAAILAWGVFVNYRPLIIAATCSEVAADSSGILTSRYKDINSDYTYEKVKNDCLDKSF